MIIALAAYKTQNVNEVPEILYLGDSGVELNTVASEQGGKGFVRLRRFQMDNGIPVSLPAAPAAKEAVKVDTERLEAAKEVMEQVGLKPRKAAKKSAQPEQPEN